MPGFFGNYREFEARYCVTRQLPGTWIKIVTGYRNKDELLDRVRKYASSLTLDDIADMPDDPPDNIVICPQPNKFIQSGVKKGVVQEYDMIIDNPAVKLMKLRQVASGFIIDEQGETHIISDTKRFAFGELLDEIGDEKVVIFCEFKASIRSVYRSLSRDRSLPMLYLTGISQTRRYGDGSKRTIT